MALLPRWCDYDAGNEVHELNDDSRRSGDLSISMMERSKTRRRSVSSLGLVLFAMLGCGESRKPAGPQESRRTGRCRDRRSPLAHPVRRRPTPGAPPDGRPPLHERPPSAGCVVHTGDIRQSTTRIKRPGGALEPAESSNACSMDAECVRRQGTATPGDRNVAINCKGKTCTCTQEQLVPRLPPKKFRFAVEAPCASMDRMQSLLLDRCVQGGSHPR